MATERANDLVAFRKFIDEQLSNGRAELKLDEALARWESENQTPNERNETIQAIRNRLQDTPGQWAQRLQAWVGSLPVRPNNMDDSRESIYSGRGE